MKNINTLISKWIIEDKLNDQDLGNKVRAWYWTQDHSKEHWFFETQLKTLDEEIKVRWLGGDDHSNNSSRDDEWDDTEDGAYYGLV